MLLSHAGGRSDHFGYKDSRPSERRIDCVDIKKPSGEPDGRILQNLS